MDGEVGEYAITTEFEKWSITSATFESFYNDVYERFNNVEKTNYKNELERTKWWMINKLNTTTKQHSDGCERLFCETTRLLSHL